MFFSLYTRRGERSLMGGLLLREQDRKQLTHYQAVGNPMPTTLGREIITGHTKVAGPFFLLYY